MWWIRLRKCCERRDTEMVFDEYARYYDLIYADKDYDGEAKYINSVLIKALGDKHPPVLELGCGTGKHAALLADMGYTICGIERSENMLAQARKRAEGKSGLSFVCSDIRAFKLEKTFGAALALFHVMSYQTSTEDFIAVLKCVREHLDDGGIFVFDTWYGPAVLTERPEYRIKRLEDEHCRVTRIAEPVLHENENIVDVNYDVFVEDKSTGTIKEFQEVHNMRYYFLSEISLMLDLCGFSMETAVEFLTGKELSGKTWGSMFIVRKTKELCI